MNDILLLKLGEVVLKGLNRRSFEARLVGNVRRRLIGLGKFNVSCMQSTVYVEPADETADLDAAFEAVQDVFGVVKISRASACEKDKDAIVRLAIDCLRDDMLRAKSFKVESKRSDKRFPMTSIQLSQYVGGELAEAYPNCAVDVHNPELIVNVEIRDLAAYVHTQPVDGAGGMPVGSNGIAVSLLSGGIDSPVSTHMIAKRGVRLVPVHFFSFPYTSQQAKEKVVELGHLLTRYCGDMTLEVVPFTHIQEEIRDKCPEEYFTLIMRRFMMRIAQRIAERVGAKAIVTGENLGQVASQTMASLACTNEVCTLPVFRPCIGMDKQEIVNISEKIGTYETSILPFEDCCTIFVAKHPVTKPSLEVIKRHEKHLDDCIDEMFKEALDTRETLVVTSE